MHPFNSKRVLLILLISAQIFLVHTARAQEAALLWAYNPGSGYAQGKTLAQSQQFCEANGSKLATKAQLLEANRKGFSMCVYGWLKGGISGYVMKGNHRGCGRDGFNGGLKTAPSKRLGAYCVGSKAPANVKYAQLEASGQDDSPVRPPEPLVTGGNRTGTVVLTTTETEITLDMDVSKLHEEVNGIPATYLTDSWQDAPQVSGMAVRDRRLGEHGQANCAAYLAGSAPTICGYLPAIPLGKIKNNGTTCKSGSFYDPIMGGSCWSCPANYIRSTKKVDGDEACWRASRPLYHRAFHVSDLGCPSGTFFDSIEGGGCWSCPRGYNRTWDPVNFSTACAKSVVGPFSYANRGISNPSTKCSGDDFYDPREGGQCWKCPNGYFRSPHAVTRNDACVKHTGTEFSFAEVTQGLACNPNTQEREALSEQWQDTNVRVTNDGVLWEEGQPKPFADLALGSCYACPTRDAETGDLLISQRTVYPADRGKACLIEFSWTPGVPEEVPLLSPKGAPAARILYKDLFAMPNVISGYLRSEAKLDGMSPAQTEQFLADSWRDIAKDPINNPYINAILFPLVMESVASAERPQDNQFANEFAILIQKRKEFIAQENLNMYYGWREKVEQQKMESNRSRAQVVYDSGTVPPDIIAASIQQIEMLPEAAVTYGGIAIASDFAAHGHGLPLQYMYAKTWSVARSKEGRKALKARKIRLDDLAKIDDLAKATRDTYRAMDSSADTAKALRKGPTSVKSSVAAIKAVRAIKSSISITRIATKLAVKLAMTAGTLGVNYVLFPLELIADAYLEQALSIYTMEPILKGVREAAKAPVNMRAMAENDIDSLRYYWAVFSSIPGAYDAEIKQAANSAYNSAKQSGFSAELSLPVRQRAVTAAMTRASNRATYLFFDDGTYAKSGHGRTVGFDTGYPQALPGGWKGLPDYWAGKIEAALPYQATKKGYMWYPELYLHLNDVTVARGYPVPMPGGWKNMPASWKNNVSAAMHYAENNKHYLFRGNQYVRLTGTRVDPGYPKNLPGGWRGMPKHFAEGIDAATYRNGHTYMIKGNEYIRFTRTRVDAGYPKPMDQWPK